MPNVVQLERKQRAGRGAFGANRAAAILCALFLAASAAQVVYAQSPAAGGVAVTVPGTMAWGDTGIDVLANEALTITAEGTVWAGRSAAGQWDDVTKTGPEGTFLYSENIARREFPLPAGGAGPAPCFCLIGRIGDSQPFYVGRFRSWKPAVSGRLYLGVNDFDVSDNKGAFIVNVAKSGAVQPLAYEEFPPIDTAPGAPAPGCSVVVFYLDGLRPDVVREMAAMGHLPNINRLFIEGGAWLTNSFTGFPSDTITSNGTMWTGCFSDRHGLKGQASFSRRTLESKSYLDPFGPSRSAREMAPEGLDKVLHEMGAESVQMIDGAEAERKWKERRVSGVPPIYAHLRHNGADWSTGALPVMTEFPPILFSRSLTKKVPYFQYHQSWRYLDDANVDYAKSFLIERNSPVTIVWLPETDSVSHHDFSRGQFGVTRRTIARADRLIGELLQEIEGRRRAERTYFILCSDHGHHGGRTENLAHYDLADEFFYKPRMIDANGTWIGGGLGLSVRQHRFWNRHPNDRPIEFVFIDADSDGAARVYLPNGHYRSGQWMGKRRPGDLLGYRIADNILPVDLVHSLTGIVAAGADGSLQHPVDLVLVKLTDDSILVATNERGNAVIHRRRDAKGKWVYKYTVVERLQGTADGGIAYEETAAPRTDPLRLIGHVHPRLLAYYHDETTWLRLTATSAYPDSVVALSRHMLWQENLAEQELEHAPDLVVTARPGWFFGTLSSPGTMHGYPFRDSMRASLFISGPNVRRGAQIIEPCRLADLTPTMLDMLGYRLETGDFDGHPLRNIYEPAVGSDVPTARQVAHSEEKPAERQPVYWDDVDLNAWNKLPYNKRPNYENLPFTVHHPDKPYDFHNIAYNLLSVSDFNLLRLVDTALYPVENGRPLVSQAFGKLAEQTRRSSIPPIADAADLLDLSTTTLGDYSFGSDGNLKRMDGVIDWLQNRANAVDGAIARQLGVDELPAPARFNEGIDRLQWGAWDTYRYAQRVAGQILDEKIINGIQDTADRSVNRFRMQPSEIRVNSPAASNGPPPPAP